MRERVHLLAHVRKAELLRAALLVFRSLRVGFPGAEVRVWGNGLRGLAEEAVGRVTAEVGGMFRNLPNAVAHDEYVEYLIQEEREPFWLLDTDLVFGERVEGHGPGRGEAEFRGRWEPEFLEEWTGTVRVERLHPSVMWIHPARLRAGMRARMARVPALCAQVAEWPFVRQTFVPVRGGRTLFYDTLAGAWQAGMGERFEEAVDRRWEHLQCGTYVDLVDAPSLRGLREGHEAVYRDLGAARGLRERQRVYYESRRTGNFEQERTEGTEKGQACHINRV